MRHFISALTLAALPPVAGAQFPERVQPGVRVRVWLHESYQQENAPWRRQLLRATVSGVENSVLQLTVPGSLGTLTVPRDSIRRLDVSRGAPSRVASAFQRAVQGALFGALSAGIAIQVVRVDAPENERGGDAVGTAAAWGAGIGAIIGIVFPTEQWRRVRLRP